MMCPQLVQVRICDCTSRKRNGVTRKAHLPITKSIRMFSTKMNSGTSEVTIPGPRTPQSGHTTLPSISFVSMNAFVSDSCSSGRCSSSLYGFAFLLVDI